MAACVLLGGALGGYLGDSLLNSAASEDDTGMMQVIRQERERASKLAGEVAAAQSQAALIRRASEVSIRERQESERTLVELRQALQSELGKTNKLAGQLAEAQRDNASQSEIANQMTAEARREAAEKERVIGELRQALQQQEAKTAEANVRATE